jgi:hypothetical protein
MSGNDDFQKLAKIRDLLEAKQAFERSRAATGDENVQRKVPNSIIDAPGVNNVVREDGGITGAIRPYGEVLDEMDHEAKYQSAVVTPDNPELTAPWFLSFTMGDQIALRNRVVDFIQNQDPFGDHFSEVDVLRVLDLLSRGR